MSALATLPAELGDRLRTARSGANLTQDAASAALGMARTTLVAIEKGQREVRPEELIEFSRLYRVSVGKLVSPDSIHVDLGAKFRRAEGKDASKAVSEALELLNRLASGAAQLERTLGQSLQTDYPPPVRINAATFGQQAEDAAANLRTRLGVGLGPIPDVVGLLESELRLRIFFRPLNSKISGLYAFDPAIGACMLINSRHARKRRIQTAAHETGHFICDRSFADILEEEEVSTSVEEKFARRFGSAFLVPASGIRVRFEQMVGANGRFDVRALILLAHQYGVATEAMCRRMEELSLLPAGSWDSIRDRGYAGELERSVLGDSAPESKPPLISPRLAYLASVALDNEVLSEGQLCDMLAVERADLRDAVAPFVPEEAISLYG